MEKTSTNVFSYEEQAQFKKLIQACDYGGVSIKARLLCLEYAVMSKSSNVLQTANEFYKFVIKDYLDVSSPESSSTDKSL